MTENYPPASLNPVPVGSYPNPSSPAPKSTSVPTPPPAGSDNSSSGTADVAKEQAASVGQGAAEAGQHVAGVAKDQAGQVASEATKQAKDLLAQARSELTSQSGTQQQRLAGTLHSLGDELHSMAHGSDQPGVATDLAKQAAGKTKDVASWLESREPGDVLDEVKSFARQRPVAFLALAVGAGLVAGRLTRGIKDAPGEPDTASPASPASLSSASLSSASYGSDSYSDVTASLATPGSVSDARPFATSQDTPQAGIAYESPSGVDGR